MAEIVERTVQGETSKRAELLASVGNTRGIMRKFAWEENWSVMKLGIRLSTGLNTSISSDIPVIVFGACNYNEITPSNHIFGMQTWDNIVNTTDFINNSGNTLRKQGGTFSFGSAGATANWLAKNTVGVSSIILLLERISTDIRVTLYMSQAGTASDVNITPLKFSESMDGGAVNTSTNHYTQRSQSTFAVNETTYGVLNAFYLDWGSPTYNMEILDAVATKIS